MHRRMKPAAAALLALCAVHCEGVGTETDNPGSPRPSFKGTDCSTDPYKTRTDPIPGAGGLPSTQSPQSLRPLGTTPPVVPTEDYDGLTCMTFSQSDAGDLRVDLWNYSGPCGAHYVDGTAKLDGSRLELVAVDRECYAGACTSACFYNFHFVVPGVPNDSDIDTYLGTVDEAGKTCFGTPVLLAPVPLSAQSSGTMCRPLGRVTPPKNCAKHGPCTFPGCTCPDGLVCAPLTASTSAVCLVPCSNDADCPNSAMKCETGACVIGATF